MANNSLLALLAQATGQIPSGNPPEAPVVDPTTSVPGQEIVVPGAAAPPATQAAPVADEPYYAPEVDRVEPSNKAMEELIPRKGMFGVKGTLRDIIGTIGDAFLLQSGNKEQYAPVRRQERVGSAMYGIDPNDPVSVQAGIDRLNAQGFSTEAQKLQEQIATQALRRAQIESADAARQSQIGTRRDKSIMDARNYASRLLAAAGNDPARQVAAANQIQKMAAALGLDPERDLGIGAEMSPEERAVYGAADMTVRQQTDIPFQERRVRAQESQAASSALRASRPPAGSTTNPTDASIAAPIIDKMGKVGYNGLTATEKEILQATGRDPTRRGTGKRSVLDVLRQPGTQQAAPKKKVFRNGKLVDQ